MKTVECIFAQNLRKRRRALHLTQKELAEKIAYSEKAVSKWENGIGMPPAALLPQLARILEASVDELLSCGEETLYYLGIDGGGTKTAFVLANAEGRVLRETVLGPSNPNDVGLPAMEEVLRLGILETAGEYHFNTISVYAGIAGAASAGNVDRIREFLSRFGFSAVGCGSDVHNALSVCLRGEDGIAVIMGTGSVAYGQRNGTLIRAGGYGYLLGDAGSGFALGRDAILAALQAEDGSGPETCLREYVTAECGYETALGGLPEFYRGGKREIARYAPLIFKACASGDAVARGILYRNMEAIAMQIRGVLARMGLRETRVVLCGGLTAEKAMIVPMLEDLLKDGTGEYNVSVSDEPTVHGALYLAGLSKITEE